MPSSEPIYSLDLKGISAEAATKTILEYLEAVASEKTWGTQRKDGGPEFVVGLFLKRWLEANQSEEAERLKAVIDKHFGTEFLKK